MAHYAVGVGHNADVVPIELSGERQTSYRAQSSIELGFSIVFGPHQTASIEHNENHAPTIGLPFANYGNHPARRSFPVNMSRIIASNKRP